MSDRGMRHWPDHSPPPAEQQVRTRCQECGLEWAVHADLAGYRLRCECGGWVQVPPLAREEPLALPVDQASLPATAPESWPRDEEGQVVLTAGVEAGLANQEIPTSLPMGPGTLMQAGVRTRQRWTNRSLLELAAMAFAFMAPYAAIQFGTTGQERALAMPLAGLASGILVLIVGLHSARHTFNLVRWAAPARFFEATLAALSLAFLAMGYSHLLSEGKGGGDFLNLVELRRLLGPGLTIFVIGLCPGIFEELAFRGLLQSRLMALFGTGMGILISGSAFALAHGVGAGFPFHITIGVYLCWLRVRAGSLVPGMWMHFLYNSTLVLLD